MLYMVECGFSDPGLVQAWNQYYTDRKLDEVLAVPGFRTSQRFKAADGRPAPYLAIHTVDNLEVLTGNNYRSGGGGSFDPTFQPCIIEWRRSLYDGLDRAPVVALDAVLAVADVEPATLGPLANGFSWLRASGLDESILHRGLRTVDLVTGEELARRSGGHVRLYHPLMVQKVEPAGKPA